ncbi:MAG TPA: peptidylprolyl isomerase [Nitrososphaerales archaeon]
MEKGSLIFVDLTARVKDTGEVIETTLIDEAKKLGIYEENRKYEPKLISVGDGWVLKGVDETLLSSEINKQITIDVIPEKAFGLRDPNKVRRILLRKFGEKASEVRVGEEIEIDNQIGLVRFIGSGRAQIDFNHKYAGKIITFDLKPLTELKTADEKAEALLHRRLPIEKEKINIFIDNHEVVINLPQETYLIEGIQIIKKALSTDILKYISGVSKVKIVETYESMKPKEPETNNTIEQISENEPNSNNSQPQLEAHKPKEPENIIGDF